MKRMSKDAEAKILTALGTVADHVNDGDQPNAAIIKAAQAHDIPAGHIRVMVHAYNTGRTAKQRVSGSDPFSKAAEFDLADADSVLEALYPSQIKTAKQQAMMTSVSPEYSRPPEFLARRASREKAAAALPQREKTAAAIVELPREDTAFEKINSAYRFDQRRLENCQLEISRAKTQLLANFEKLAEYFAQPGCISFGDVRAAAILQRGKSAEAIFRHLSTFHPRLEKQAATGRLVCTDPRYVPFALINYTCKLAEDVVAAERNFQELSQHITEKYAELLSPFFHQPSGSVLGGSEKAAGFPTILAIPTALNSLKQFTTDKVRSMYDERDGINTQRTILEKLDNPRHDERFRAAEAEIMLNDLMVNDPEIMQHDPRDVVMAFNEISRLAPRVATQPLLMQGLLRRRLSQGFLDPFDTSNAVLKPEEQILASQDQKWSPGHVPGSAYLPPLPSQQKPPVKKLPEKKPSEKKPSAVP